MENNPQQSPQTDAPTVPAPPSGSEQPTAQKKRMSKGLKIMLICDAALVAAIAALLVVRDMQGKKATEAASTLLESYQSSLSASPVPGVDAPVQVTPSPADLQEIEVETEFMHEDDSDGVDVTGAYVQPEAPVTLGNAEATQEAIAKVGEDGVIGIIRIPELEVELPVIGEWSYSLLNVSVCRFQGPGVNQPGNLIILGHNFKNGAHFGRLTELTVGSEVFMTGADGKEIRYTVYKTDTVGADDLAALEEYQGECGLTLVSCEDGGNTYRRIVRCVMDEG